MNNFEKNNEKEISSFEHPCAKCGQIVATSGFKQAIEQEKKFWEEENTKGENSFICSNCKMEADGTMAKIVAQEADRKKHNQALGIKE